VILKNPPESSTRGWLQKQGMKGVDEFIQDVAAALSG
jgi:hypothetical protein